MAEQKKPSCGDCEYFKVCIGVSKHDVQCPARASEVVLNIKVGLAKKGLNEIIYANPVAVNGVWDRAGYMERLAKKLLEILE
jgi:hypothetical protein